MIIILNTNTYTYYLQQDLNMVRRNYFNCSSRDCTLLMGWIIGCLPTSSPFPNSPNFRTSSSCSAPAIHCYIITIIDLLISLDSFASNNGWISQHPKLSDRILFICLSLMTHLEEFLYRCVIISTCGKLVKLVTLCNTCSPKYKSWRSQRNINHLVIITTLITQPLLVLYFGYVDTKWTFEFSSFVFPRLGFLHIATRVFREVLSSFVGLYATIIVLFLGLDLCNSFKEFYSQFEYNFVHTNNRVLDLQRFDRLFGELRQSFYIFNEVGGIYCLILILENTFYLLYDLISLAFSSSPLHFAVNLLGVWLSTITIFAICRLGEVLKKEIFREKLKLDSVLLKNDALLDDKAINKMITAMKDFKWKFTANDLFDINYKLLLNLTGCMMTICIFMFQLKMTEESFTTMPGS